MTENQPNKQPIVVGIDGSENSLAALRWALREGSATGAPVEVVHSWTAETFPDLILAPPHELKTASFCMLQNEVAAALSEISDPPVVTELSLHGNPSNVLVERAENARVLVLGVRETTVMRDLAYGSVVNHCRKRAKCPVVTVDSLHVVTWHGSPTHQAAVTG